MEVKHLIVFIINKKVYKDTLSYILEIRISSNKQPYFNGIILIAYKY